MSEVLLAGCRKGRKKSHARSHTEALRVAGASATNAAIVVVVGVAVSIVVLAPLGALDLTSAATVATCRVARPMTAVALLLSTPMAYT